MLLFCRHRFSLLKAGVPIMVAIAGLAELSSRAPLVVAVPTGATMRFTLLQTLAQYGRERLTERVITAEPQLSEADRNLGDGGIEDAFAATSHAGASRTPDGCSVLGGGLICMVGAHTRTALPMERLSALEGADPVRSINMMQIGQALNDASLERIVRNEYRDGYEV